MWAGMLELSFTEYFEKLTNTLRALMHARTGGPCKWRDGNPKKESKRSAGVQKHCSRNEE